jgi:hypothetical protein
MTITELIAELQRLLELHGDLPCRVDTLSHTFPPDLVVRKRPSGQVLILNG